MKNSKRLFSLIVIASMLLWEINPVLPALARQTEEAKQDVASKRAPVATDWSAVDWDGPVVLLTDQQEYRQELEKLLSEGKQKEARELQPKKNVLSSEEAMEYFAVPENIKEVVRGYRDGTGLFAKNKDKELLRSLIKNLTPNDVKLSDSKTELEENFIDVSKAEKLNVKKLIPFEHGKNQPTVKIKSVKDNVADHALRSVTIDGLKKKTKEKYNFGQKLLGYFNDLFKVNEVHADEVVPLIEYYDGIENNILDNALYYISKSQNDDGSFGQVANYEETAETALMLSEIKRTSNTQFSDAINYLTNTEPQNNREKAIKARLMVGLSKPYLNYLDELVLVKNVDHGYGLDVGMESDMLTTMEVALAMYAANYSIQDEMPLAIFHVLNRIPENGALRYTEDGPVSYYLINKIAQELKPFEDMTVGNGEINIVVQNKIDALLGYLSSQFDSDSEKILGTNDIIDQIVTLETWQYYGVEVEKQSVLEKTVKGGQYIDGGFGNSVLATTYALKTLKQPDLVLTDVQSVGVLESKQQASFDLTIKNQGYAKADDGIIYIFPDNFNGGLNLNLKSNGIVIQPNQTIVLNFSISDTKSYTGVMDMKFYAEVVGDYNHENNWIYKNFTFAPAANGAPALPMYFIAQKYENDGVAGLNVRWQKKTDPNRLNYVIMWREKGIAQWNFQGISNTWNGAFLTGGFVEGKTYEVTAGVLHQDGETVTYFVNYNDVVTSANDKLYLGGATGYATNNNEKLPNVYTWAFGGGEKTDGDGNFANSGIENGSNAAWVDVDYYESIATKFLVPVNATTTAVRLFSRLLPDNQAPVMTGMQLKWPNNYIVKSQTEYTLSASGSDNIGIKEADFFLWNSVEEVWTYLGTQGAQNSNSVSMLWYVPADLLGVGYKVKAIFSDYQGNKSNAVEWGPFEIINGTPPIVKLLSPNGGEEWPLGSSQNVTWEANSPYGVSKISLYSDYDGQVDTINSNLQNSGSYQWNIPLDSNYAGTKIKLKVKAQDAQNFYTAEDSSDGYFTITDPSPDPEKPWSRPELVSDFDSHTVSNCSLSNPLLDYDSNGVLHIFYYCISDIYGNPRIITEQIYHVTKNDDILSKPEVVYEKASEIYDNDYSNYRSINPTSLKLVISSNKMDVIWQSSGWGGCESFNQDELFYLNFNGQTWSTVQNLSNNNTAMGVPDIAVDTAGDLHVVWQDGKMYDSECNYTGDYVLNYLKKDGAVWSGIQQIVLGESAYDPQISVTDDSKLHLVYENNNLTLRHAYKTTAWSEPTTLFVSSGGGGMNSGGLKSGVGGRLHYSFNQYYADPINGSGYRTMYVNYNGSQWLPAEEVYPVKNKRTPGHPKLTVEKNNKLSLIVEYYNSENNTKHLLWKRKGSSGTWTEPTTIDLASQYVENNSGELMYHDEKLSAVWIAYYAKKGNVFLNQANLKEETVNALHLPFDEATGAILFNDASGNANNGSCSGSTCPVSGLSGNVEKMANFDGVNDSVSVPNWTNFAPKEAVTVEVWIKPGLKTPTDITGMIIASKQRTYELNVINPKSQTLQAIIRNEAGQKVSVVVSKAYKLGEWSHVVMTYDGANIKLYVNGTLKGTSPQTGLIMPSPYPLEIGKLTNGLFYLGGIDELKVYNQALTAEEVQKNYDDSQTGPNPLRLHLKFDETAGALQFIDSSVNNLSAVCASETTCPAAGQVSQVNGGILLDGINDTAQVASSEDYAVSQAVTVEAWIKPGLKTPTDITGMVIASKQRTYELNVINPKSQTLQAIIRNTAGQKVSVVVSKAYKLNEWSHVVMTYDGANIKLYVNGALKGTSPQTGLIMSSPYPLEIGKLTNGLFYLGGIDELKVYNQALTPEEIQQKYNQTKTL